MNKDNNHDVIKPRTLVSITVLDGDQTDVTIKIKSTVEALMVLHIIVEAFKDNVPRGLIESLVKDTLNGKFPK